MKKLLICLAVCLSAGCKILDPRPTFEEAPGKEIEFAVEVDANGLVNGRMVPIYVYDWQKDKHGVLRADGFKMKDVYLEFPVFADEPIPNQDGKYCFIYKGNPKTEEATEPTEAPMEVCNKAVRIVRGSFIEFWAFIKIWLYERITPLFPEKINEFISDGGLA